MSNGFLLDTMTVSEGSKPQPDTSVAAWLEAQSIDVCYISVLTLGEIRFGIERLPNASARRGVISQWVHDTLLPTFGNRILAFDAEAALVWGSIVAASLGRGLTIPTVDAQIAATARVHDLTLVTRNTRHFAATGVRIIDPWSD